MTCKSDMESYMSGNTYYQFSPACLPCPEDRCISWLGHWGITARGHLGAVDATVQTYLGYTQAPELLEGWQDHSVDADADAECGRRRRRRRSTCSFYRWSGLCLWSMYASKVYICVSMGVYGLRLCLKSRIYVHIRMMRDTR